MYNHKAISETLYSYKSHTYSLGIKKPILSFNPNHVMYNPILSLLRRPKYSIQISKELLRRLTQSSTMICRHCLQRASALRISSHQIRMLTSSAPAGSSSPVEAPSANAVPPLSTPLSPFPNASSKPKLKSATLPASISPAGTPLKGLNFLKGREDPLALPEEDYPEWLWKILESGKKRGEEGKEEVGDEFCT